jgi:putative peptidoglycan lipid II flippase
MVTQGLVAFRLGLHWPKVITWTKEMRQLLTLTAPRLAALGATQLSLVVLLSFASTLRSGSVAVFQLGNNLQSFPLGVIGVSFAVAAFPLLSEAAGLKRFDQYHNALEKTGRMIVFFLLPVSLLFILLRAQLVRLILGDGLFDWTATIETADVVGWFSVSLVAQALIPLLARAFYAIQSTWTPFWITITGELLNIVLALILKDSYGVAGLAIAFSVTTFFQLGMLWLALRRRVGGESQTRFIKMVVQAGLACVPAMLTAYLTRHLVGTLVPLRTFWQVATQFIAASGVAGAVYFACLWFVRIDEARVLADRGVTLYRRFRPARPASR